MDDLPMNRNINWVQLIAAVAMLLAMFGINLDPKTQAAIVATIVGASTVLTWILHTFVNHPANQAKALAMADKAVAKVKGLAPTLLLLFLIVATLNACGAFPSQDPKTILSEVQFGAALAEATYESICPPGGGASFCADNAANYQKAKTALNAAIISAARAIDAANDTNTSTVAALLNALQADWAAYNQIVNTVQAKDAAMRHTTYRAIPLR